MKRIPSLDGLRAISITLVIVGHYFKVHGQLGMIAGHSNTGVRIFFVISGYLITTLLLREHERTETISLRNFYIRRAYRIFPAAFAFIVPVLFLYRGDFHWYNALAALLYCANFDFSRPWYLGHLWSLGVEEQFYFLWPSVLRKWYRYRVAILLGVLGCSPVYSLACYAFKVRAGGYGTFPAVADNLAIGCLAAILAPKIGKVPRAVAVVMLFAVVFIPSFAGNTRSRTVVELFALWPVLHISIAGILLHVVQTPYRILNIKPVVFLGKISYSLYLWQQLFFYSPRPLPLWAASTCSFGLACLSYYLVEKPFLRLREHSGDVAQVEYSLASAVGD